MKISVRSWQGAECSYWPNCQANLFIVLRPLYLLHFINANHLPLGPIQPFISFIIKSSLITAFYSFDLIFNIFNSSCVSLCCDKKWPKISSRESSVARLGKILKAFGNFLRSYLLKIWQNFELTLAIFLAFKWPNIEEIIEPSCHTARKENFPSYYNLSFLNTSMLHTLDTSERPVLG